ncbi:unnamed protein product, partial [Meganyctiphanes norvegica]
KQEYSCYGLLDMSEKYGKLMKDSSEVNEIADTVSINRYTKYVKKITEVVENLEVLLPEYYNKNECFAQHSFIHCHEISIEVAHVFESAEIFATVNVLPENCIHSFETLNFKKVFTKEDMDVNLYKTVHDGISPEPAFDTMSISMKPQYFKVSRLQHGPQLKEIVHREFV